MRKEGLVWLFSCLVLIYLPSVSATQTYLNESVEWDNNLTNVSFSALLFGDMNNDGYPDLVSTGQCGISCYSAKVYLNNGSTFIASPQWHQNLTTIAYGSIALGDIDNEGDLDLVLTGCKNGGGSLSTTCDNPVSYIYLNNGSALIESQQWRQNLTNSWKGSVSLGDVDNDGDLDLAMTGTNDNGKIAKVYINNGTTFTENQTWQQNLLPSYESANAFGDVNNDGYLDLAVCGDIGISSETTTIYLNNRTSFNNSASWSQNLLGVDWCSLTFGDYDNDSDLDFSLMGHTNADNHRIYRNNGSTFVIVESESNALTGIYAGSLTFVDYNSDGYLEIIATGNEGFTTINLYNWTTDNFSVYSNDPESHLANLDRLSDVAWADIDNDSDLDLGMAGWWDTTIENEVKIYINNRSLTKPNARPQPPNSSLQVAYSGNQLTLSWGNGSDNETSTSGLNYNLRVGVAGNKNSIISGVFGGSSDPTAGYFGNMMQRKSITLSNARLQNGTTYFWSVQTIDTGLIKSEWSEEQNFTLTSDIDAPSIIINFPADSNYTSFSNITFSVNVSDNVNITNVSLYGGWGNWHRNQTNSSGLNGTEYIFQANLSAYSEGTYLWAIHACDTSSNCIFSGNRTLIRDLNAPQLYSEYPANSTNWVDNNTIVFRFNVTDLSVVNCSFILNSTINYTFSSPAVNTTLNYTLSLDNGYYNWSVNCTDNLMRQNSSGARNFTLNYQTPSSGSSGGGGGGSGPSFITHNAGNIDSKENGINRELKKEDRIKFNVSQEAHVLLAKFITIGSASFELNSTPLLFTLLAGETRKFNLTSYLAYDLTITLNKISDNRANVTLNAITELIPQPEQKSEGKTEENITSITNSESQQPEGQNKISAQGKLSDSKYYLIIFLVLAGLAAAILLVKRMTERNRKDLTQNTEASASYR